MKASVQIMLQTDIALDKETGQVMAVYFHVRKGRSAETREFDNGNAFADYDTKGRLLGVEVLGPCKVTILDRISRKEPKPVKTFLRSSIPAQMLTTV
jgi:uncharacterized protein YuzE